MPNVQVFQTPEEVARAGADFIVNLAKPAARNHPFSVALSGGNTPRRVYELLASTESKNKINWQFAHLFFGDERPVRADHPASNYGMALATLISRVPIPPGNVHPISGEGTPRESAKSYQHELKSYFGNSPWPRFDLVLLGMGEDGHTASLFPGTKALAEKEAWVVANWVEQLNEFRLTLTAPAINSAAQILFLVTGENKAAPLAKVLNGPFQPDLLPAQLIEPDQGELTWIVDATAASLL